ncbi:MAG: TIGR01212 family radical SAM protein [Ruminococcaceae bacterium]|nr:TIGR01212 family radical SAM protein [Oscillospiraceae bacterium]
MVRYNTYSEYLKNKYGEKVYKLPVNLPITCPNRDGCIGTGGCIFCGEVGAAFENLSNELSVKEQIRQNMEYIGKKYKAEKFIVYFQNFTNTYMSFEKFKSYVDEAIVENVVEIGISTRPDCIRDEYLSYLNNISKSHNINISIEMGLQTVNYKTLAKVNRGHTLAEFIDAVLMIKKYDFDICAHLILNLPWDDKEDVIECAKILSALKVNQVKLHCLYIVKDTEMAKLYSEKAFDMGSYYDYVEKVILFLEYLSPDIIIQRLIGRAKEEHTVFANYNTSWWKIKDNIDEQLEFLDTYQGKKFDYLNGKCVKKFFK